MRTVKTYRLGTDNYVAYVLPKRRDYADRLEQTWGSVYSLIERCEIKGCIPEAWPRLAASQQEPIPTPPVGRSGTSPAIARAGEVLRATRA